MDLLKNLNYTRSELRGIVVLASIILGITLARVLLISLQPSKKLSLSNSNAVPAQVQTVAIAAAKPKVELNAADSTILDGLYGIGPSFARRILKYRSLLGGYYAKEQLLEVYGMDSARYLGFVEDVEVDTALLVKMNLRTIEFKPLLRHPYTDYTMVKDFFQYRDKYGPPTKVDAVWEAGIWPDSVKNRLRNYLSAGQ